MKIKKINKHPFILTLYTLTAAAFILAMVKHAILNKEINALFILLEILSFILILVVLYLSIRSYFSSNNLVNQLKSQILNLNREWKKENERLEAKIERYEEKENEAKRFDSYQEKMINKLFSNTVKIKNEHHFLHTLAKIFHAGSAILYKETEQSGHFAVQETYALPEDYKPSDFSPGEGFNGQAVTEKQPITIDKIPDEFLPISSGLGKTKGSILYLLPVIKENKCTHLIEMVAFKKNEIEKMWKLISDKLIENEIL